MASFVNPPFSPEGGQHQAARDAQRDPGCRVSEGDLPAKRRGQQRDGDFVDQGGGDQKGEGDPNGKPRLHEAQKNRRG